MTTPNRDRRSRKLPRIDAWEAELAAVREAGRRAGRAAPATAESVARLSTAMGVALRIDEVAIAKGA